MKVLSEIWDGAIKRIECGCGRRFSYAPTHNMENAVLNEHGNIEAKCPACGSVSDMKIKYAAICMTALDISSDGKNLESKRLIVAVGRYENMTKWASNILLQFNYEHQIQSIEVVKITKEEYDAILADVEWLQKTKATLSNFDPELN